MASTVSADTGCGASDSPWLVELLPGQRINITLFDFAVFVGGGGGGGGGPNASAAAASSLAAAAAAAVFPRGDGGDDDQAWPAGETVSVAAGGVVGGPGGEAAGPKMCRVYAVIREASVARGVTICGGETRSRPVYVSLENVVEIRLIAGKAAHNGVSFMLRYEGKEPTGINEGSY